MKTSWKTYSRLASTAYPNTFKRTQQNNGSTGDVWLDTPSSWKTLPDFRKDDVIRALEKEIESGKRSFNDKVKDNRVI